MPKFVITEERPATYYWTYEVEAETAEDAIELVEEGDIESMDSRIDIDYNLNPDYTVNIKK